MDPKCNHRYPFKGGGILGRLETDKEGNVATERRCYITGFEDGRGHKSKSVRNAALKPGKIKETDSPLRSPEGARPSGTNFALLNSGTLRE